MGNPIIKVMSFKDTGKLYASEETELKDIHYMYCPARKGEAMTDCTWESMTMANYEATQRLIYSIRSNDPKVEDYNYSGLTCGFDGHFYYVIEVLFSDDEYGHCLFHMDKTKHGRKR